MTSKNLLSKNLLINTIEVRKRIEDQSEQFPYRNSLITVIADIEFVLNNQPIDLKRLKKNEFGIFRMVTDNASLEDNSIGKELFSLLKEIYQFRRTIKDDAKLE